MHQPLGHAVVLPDGYRWRRHRLIPHDRILILEVLPDSDALALDRVGAIGDEVAVPCVLDARPIRQSTFGLEKTAAHIEIVGVLHSLELLDVVQHLVQRSQIRDHIFFRAAGAEHQRVRVHRQDKDREFRA